MSAVGQALRGWLLEEGLEIEEAADGDVIEVTIPETADRKLRVIARDGDPFLHFSMVARTKVPRARWTALYPLLSDVNTQTIVGAWVLDPPTEQIVFRLSIPSAGASYDGRALRAVLAHVAATVSQFESSFRAAQDDGILAAWRDEPDTGKA
jgi:hypothetical protein